MLQSALDELITFHGSTNFGNVRLRYEEVKITIPMKVASSLSPYRATIDLKPYMDAVRRGAPVGPNGRLVFSVEVIAEVDEKRSLSWRFPPLQEPSLTLTLDENDISLTKFRDH